MAPCNGKVVICSTHNLVIVTPTTLAYQWASSTVIACVLTRWYDTALPGWEVTTLQWGGGMKSRGHTNGHVTVAPTRSTPTQRHNRQGAVGRWRGSSPPTKWRMEERCSREVQRRSPTAECNQAIITHIVSPPTGHGNVSRHTV